MKKALDVTMELSIHRSNQESEMQTVEWQYKVKLSNHVLTFQHIAWVRDMHTRIHTSSPEKMNKKSITQCSDRSNRGLYWVVI